jgi:hypothetical protein
LNDGDSAGAEFAFGIAPADDHFWADGKSHGKNIDFKLHASATRQAV